MADNLSDAIRRHRARVIRRVLFVTDGVAANAAAQRVAVNLAMRSRAKVTALGIVDAPWIMRPEGLPIGTIAYDAASKAKQLERAHARVHGALRRLKQSAGRKVALVTSEVEEDPLATINSEAIEHDIVVIGRKTSFRLGSPSGTSDLVKSLVRECPRPVFVISSVPKTTSRTVVAFDGSLPASRALHMAALLGLVQRGRTEVVSIGPKRGPVKTMAERAATLLRSHGAKVNVSAIESTRDPANVILARVRASRAEIVVMGAYGHGGLRNVVFGSCTRRLLSDCRAALLLLR